MTEKEPSDRSSRSEREIFEDLRSLCTSKGYAHALAFLSFRNNFMGVGGGVSPEVLEEFYSEERLLRTETATLIGLLLQGQIDLDQPDSRTIQGYLDRTNALLEELHGSLAAEMAASVFSRESLQSDRPHLSGAAWREPIFYSAESAYNFQYRDLVIPKYRDDNSWLRENCGFSIEEGAQIAVSVCRIVEDKITSHLMAFAQLSPNKRTMLPPFTVTTSDVIGASGLEESVVRRFLNRFSNGDEQCNSSFGALSDFNVANARPLIGLGEDRFLLFQPYQLLEALYESPFYWMCGDSKYQPNAMANRGRFAEDFAFERLIAVFGPDRVYKNVEVMDSKGRVVGEIDVLVVFADRVIVLQAKSKRLTIEARKGNDQVLNSDFKRAIQDAYSQAVNYGLKINDPNYSLRLRDSGSEVEIIELSTIYPLCVVADHYPALSAQARHFLLKQTGDSLAAPMVMDIFFLDVMTEFLSTPLHFLSYVNRRTEYEDTIIASSEFPILGYHLKRNLWVPPHADIMQMADDLTVEIDSAMLVRREGLPGEDTPEGILTALRDTTLTKLLNEASNSDHPAAVNFGFLLLTLNEETYREISNSIDLISRRAQEDGVSHDFSINIEDADAGLTVHYNSLPEEDAHLQLTAHCELRKYAQKVSAWFGVCIDAESGSFRFGVHLKGKWKYSPELDQHVKSIPSSAGTGEPQGKWDGRTYRRIRPKTGRNKLCPCGSGRKHKHCCLNKNGRVTKR